jgi:hypothetical protein
VLSGFPIIYTGIVKVAGLMLSKSAVVKQEIAITAFIFKQYCRAYVATIIRRGIGLTTGFIGSHTVTVYTLYTRSSLQYLPSLLTITTESLQGPGPPADPTGSRWPSTNSSGLFSATHRQLTRNWNCPIMAVDVRAI